MTGQVGFIAAFLAGVVSFLSPCVLPLYPAYVSFMTGMSLAELTEDGRSTGAILRPVLMFVLGFTLVFVALGASASALGSLINANKDVLTQVAGIVIVVMGVVMLDVVPLPFMHGGGIDANVFRKYGVWASLALGLAFPFALGACAGPVYGAILTLAINSSSVGTGVALLFVYSLGLAAPFVATSLLLERMTGTLKWFAKHAKTINRVAGALLVLMGLAMTFGVFDYLGSLLQSVPGLNAIG